MSKKESAINQVTKRYAAALIDSADSQEKLEKMIYDFRAIDSIISQCEDFRKVLTIPTIEKKKLINAISLIAEKEEKMERTHLWREPLWGGLIVFLLAIYWVSRKVLGLI